MHIDLTPAESELIAGLLDKELEDIRSELHHTQSHDYKEALREREKHVRDLLTKIRG